MTPTPTTSAPARIGVTSEIGALRAVICHTPGPELLAVTPSNREQFLYDDIIDLEQARREHDVFRRVLERFADVYEVTDLLTEIVDEPAVRRTLIERVTEVSSSAPLGRELAALPAAELIATFVEGRQSAVGPISRMFHKVGYDLPPLPNLYFTRDAAMVVGDGVIIGAMRYAVRWTEELLMKALFSHHPLLQSELIYDGSEENRADYTVEGGDVLVVRPDLALIGLSERSSPTAVESLVGRLREKAGIRDVIVVVLPPQSPAIHLDMILTMVDREQCVVFPPYFDGPGRLPVLHYAGGSDEVRERPDLFTALREVDMPVEPIFCGGRNPTAQEREQWASGCNFVAVRPGVVLGYSRNEETVRAMEREGGYRMVQAVDYLEGHEEVPEEGQRTIITFDGAELVRGGGGARCMTMPVRRDPAW